MAELVSDAKSHNEVIRNFSTKISNRETQLEDQSGKTKQYNESLELFENERARLLVEAEDLTKTAKIALEYKTAEGISAAFAEKYSENKKNKRIFYWLVGAAVFILIVVLLGIQTFTSPDLTYPQLLSRAISVPVLIAAGWFCAGQYVKQINITEDYGYKSVLAKSLVGFSDQLSTQSDRGPEYSQYIASVMNEIHKDPLRKRGQKEHSQTTSDKSTSAILDELRSMKSKVEELARFSKPDQ